MSQARKASELTARSVIASTLLGTDPPELPARVLVRAAELFGITDGTARVALSRMVANGELTSEDGTYRLSSPRLLERQSRQRASRAAQTHAWGGGWALAVVTSERRSAASRAELRDHMRALRLGELREGVWTRPENVELVWPELVVQHCVLATGAHLDGHVAEELWDLRGWAVRASALRREMAPLVRRLDRHDTAALAPGFVVSAAVLRHFQADPLLPEELLPARWPGASLRTDYDRFDAAYRAVLLEWFRANG